MLNVIEYGKDEYEFPALIVLGCFDAIHQGHRELLKKAKLQAKINGLDLGVMVFKDGKGGKLVYSFEERLAILEKFNVKFVLAVDFNDEFKKIAPLDFLHEIEDKINVKAYMSGKDFRFGAQAKGKSSTLKNYADDEENGVWYMPIKDVVADGEKISTTLIKSCLDAGNIAKANALLGEEFTVSGEVVSREGRGTAEVGFPTANIIYPEWKYAIKYGVYSVKSDIDGTEYNGIANFGNCPTFGDDRIALEVYFEGFSGDLYGKTLNIKFVDYLRDIEKFASAEELSEQLESDLQVANNEIAIAENEIAVADAQQIEEVAEEVTEEETEQPVEEVAEEIIEQPVEEAAEEITEEVAEQPVEEVTEEVTEQPVEEVAEEITEQPVEEVAEEVTEQPVEEVAEEVAEQPVEEVAEEVVEQPAEEVSEEVTEQPAEEVAEEATEQPVEEVAEEVTENVTEEAAITATEDFQTEEESSEECENDEQVSQDGEENVD